MTESHKQRMCMDCREWIDARAATCYLCGAEKETELAGSALQAHTERMNAHLFGEGNAAMRDHAATRNIPSGNLNGRQGPQGNAYAGARGRNELYAHIRQQLREATGA